MKLDFMQGFFHCKGKDATLPSERLLVVPPPTVHVQATIHNIFSVVLFLEFVYFPLKGWIIERQLRSELTKFFDIPTESDYFSALESGDVEIVKRFLELHVDAARTRVGYEYSETPLYIACKNGHFKIVQLLLEKLAGFNINARVRSPTGMKETALLVSIRLGNLKIVKVLLNNGANVHARYVGNTTAIMHAAESSCIDKQLGRMRKGFMWGLFPFDKESVLDVLACEGIEIDRKDMYGETALMKAATWNHVNTVKKLLDLGADMHLRNDKGLSAYNIIMSGGCNRLQKLIQNRFDVVKDSKSTDSSTASSPGIGRFERVHSWSTSSVPDWDSCPSSFHISSSCSTNDMHV